MNRGKRLADILLLTVNSIAITGALLEVFGIPWGLAVWNGFLRSAISGSDGGELREISGNAMEAGMVDGVLFWGCFLLFCLGAGWLWKGRNRRKTWLRMGVLALLYVALGIIFRKYIACGLLPVLQKNIENLNAFYDFHIALPEGGGLLHATGSLGEGLWGTAGVLFCVFPLEILMGYGWKCDRMFSLIMGHTMWFTAACTLNVFPDVFWLALCVLGVVVVLVWKDFEEAPGAGWKAVLIMAGVAGGILGFSYFTLLPALDEQYGEIWATRESLYKVVNEEWIPGVRSIFSGIGIGAGVDVTGNLNRTNVFAYSSAEAYRVTVDQIPQGTLYLKGFVGAKYGEKAWEAYDDRHLEEYYREHGLELPADYRQLANMGYEAAGASGGGEGFGTGRIVIEEVGGKGSYSIYPYGALLTEEFQVYGDSSVARKGKEYEFQYRTFRGNHRTSFLGGEWERMERQYREYVYDNFCEFPAKQLPLLKDSLEGAGIRTESVSICALDLMKYLEKQAVYYLDADKNPPDKDFVEYFLYESHEGYCVHFASAGVLAFRCFGIPARYVTGYVVSPEDFFMEEEGYTAVVTGKQAHAWTEVYLDGTGWVPVEMTPGAVAVSGDNRLEMLTGLDSWMEEPVSAMAQGGYLAWADNLEEDTREFMENSTTDTELRENMESEWNEWPGATTEPLEAGQETEAASNDNAIKQDAASQGDGVGQGGTEEGRREGFGALLWKYGLFPVIIVSSIMGSLYLIWFILGRVEKRYWGGVMGNAEVEDRIFLLYRNLRKVLSIVGCSDKIPLRGEGFGQKICENCPDLGEGEYENFCLIMEKSTFGRDKPTMEDLGMVRAFHDRLVRGVYGKIPFYKRVMLRVLGCHV